MSRTNPYKKKRRSADKTVFIYTEGSDEDSFLKYLKSLYSQNSNVAITIRKGRGGSADRLVLQAYRIQGDFSKRILVLDNDKGKREMRKARQEANNRAIGLLEHTPCLEGMLLATLREGKDFSKKTSEWCKKEFESKYIDSKDRDDRSCYKKHFPKNLLNKRRLKLPDLDKLISLMEGNRI